MNYGKRERSEEAPIFGLSIAETATLRSEKIC